MEATKRCAWVTDEPLYQTYHDREWGRPQYDEQKLFEQLLLEGAQAGLSWWTVLQKRAHYRRVFYQFNPQRMASMTDKELECLLVDPGIIRNRLKVYGFRQNAQAFLKLSQTQSFSAFIWSFVEGKSIINRWRNLREVPIATPQAKAMSKSLKKAGFTFVGPTICYAFMQAAGLVNDHTLDCFCHPDNRD